jgi:hypothetical protein
LALSSASACAIQVMLSRLDLASRIEAVTLALRHHLVR